MLRHHDHDPEPRGQHAEDRIRDPLRPHRTGSRAPNASRTANPNASTAITSNDTVTFAVAATVPPMRGPRKNPNATELALSPKAVLCASGGVSSPIMLAV